MGTRQRWIARLSVAAVITALAGMLLATTAAAQGGDCTVSVSPASVPVGGQFTVTGNFGGAEVYLVEGADASPAEGAEPDATTPAGSSFSVTFVAEAGDEGTWTVWGLIPASECGGSAALTITAGGTTIPNTATAPAPAPATVLGVLLVTLATAAVFRRAEVRTS